LQITVSETSPPFGLLGAGFMQYPLSGTPAHSAFLDFPQIVRPKINWTGPYMPVHKPYSTRTVRPVLDFISTAHASCELELHKIGPGVVLALRRVTPTPGLTISSWAGRKLNPKEAGRMAPAPESFVDAEKATRVSVFSWSPCVGLPARAKSRRTLWARETPGMAVSAF
jgi:hypothetical protein